MEKETELKPKQITIQSLVDFMGNEIEKHEFTDSIVKGIGEVKIKNKLYQIKIILESDKDKWVLKNGVQSILETKKKQSWLMKKISSLFTSTTDAEAQK